MEPEDFHPYDGKERRFRDDDADPEARGKGRVLVARLLQLSARPPAAGLRYDLSLYSGGIGVMDRLHVAMPCSSAELEAIVARTGMLTPAALRTTAENRESFDWLVNDDVMAFVETQRRPFQPRPDVGCRVWFSPGSDVNAWSLIYAADGELAFIAYDQG